MGFQRTADGYDPLSPGFPRDSWGLAVNGTGGVYADQSTYGSAGVTSASTYKPGGATVASVTSLGFDAVHKYSFVAPSILLVSGTVTNHSGLAGAVVYQRDVDWDVNPTMFAETSSGPMIAGQVSDSSSYGMEHPDPTVPYSFSCMFGCSSSGDLGGGIRIDLGTLAPGASARFLYL